MCLIRKAGHARKHTNPSENGSQRYTLGHPTATRNPADTAGFVVRRAWAERKPTMSKQYDAPPELSIDPEKDHTATIKTAKGDIVIQLYAKSAPLTVNNFVFLAQDGFYDGVTFHRVIPGFMAQTGDPTGTGRGGPGYRFNDEASALKNRHSDAGILSMANAGPNTNGSQFFITYGPTPHLDGKHAVFGTVVKGIDVLKSISERDPGRSSTPGDVIETIEFTVA